MNAIASTPVDWLSGSTQGLEVVSTDGTRFILVVDDACLPHGPGELHRLRSLLRGAQASLQLMRQKFARLERKANA